MRVRDVTELPAHMHADVKRQMQGHAPDALQRLEAKLDRGTPNAVVVGRAAKPSKFGNTRVFLEGEWFDSKLEYDCFCELKLRKVAGEIAYTKRQVTFVLEGGVKYRADFECVLTPGYAAKVGYCAEVWDAKGYDTRSSINKRRQVVARYGIEVRLWKK